MNRVWSLHVGDKGLLRMREQDLNECLCDLTMKGPKRQAAA